MPYEDKIMVASGDSEHPGTEEVSFETIPSHGDSGFNPDNLSVSTNTPSDADEIITKESSTWYRKTFSKVWDYIKSKIQGSSNEVAYGTCSTAADVAAKVATLNNAGNWVLKKGCMVAIKFTNTNTFSAASGSPVTLNVNNTGAKNIYWGNSSNPTGTNTTPFGRANYINTYLYDGTYWVWQGSSADNNSNNATRQYPTNTTNADYRVLFSNGANDNDETNLTRKDTNFKYNPSTNNLTVEKINNTAVSDFATKVDLSNISITGTTNNTGSTIASGTYFYLNGALVRAKADIANNATLTLNTNYETVTAGGLNKLNADIATLKEDLSPSSWSTTGLTFENSIYQSGGYVKIGKLVIVCIRVKTKNTINQYGNYILSGLPVPIVQNPDNYVGLNCTSIINHNLYLNSYSGIQLYSATSINADEVLMISGSYIEK